MPSENGWEPARANPSQCEWVRIPGAEHVSLQILKGQPLQILRAFAADYHAYVEPLRDADSACWTPTNSVPTSNHLNGTGMDLNWNGADGKTFRLGIPKERAFPGAQSRAVDELLAFYEGMVFNGGAWSIRDHMHWQMGGNTYNNPRTADFIRRKIRADGFSTYKRGGAGGSPPPVVQPPAAVNVLDVLKRATGVNDAKAREILLGVQNGLRDSQCTNVNRIAMWLAQIGHESAGFNATEEYQSGDESTDRWKYKGRTWIQITWRSNYAGLSEWAHGKGIVPTPTYFVDNPKKLAEIQYAGLGPAWYWTVARPQINSLCDKRDLVAVTQAINGGQNGAADRKRRYDMASALGDQLLALTSSAPTEGFLMALSDAEQREVLTASRELTKRFPSRSPLRHLGEGLVDTLAGFALNTDGHGHVQLVKLLASLGHPPSLALLREVAGADPVKYPDRQDDAKVAQAILAELQQPQSAARTVAYGSELADAGAEAAAEVLGVKTENARLREENARLQQEVADTRTAMEVYEPDPAITQSGTTTTGQRVGQVVDSVEEFMNRAVEMNPKELEALTRALSVLQLSQTNGTKK